MLLLSRPLQGGGWYEWEQVRVRARGEAGGDLLFQPSAQGWTTLGDEKMRQLFQQ